jgi:regulator of PEP synthase PpsR (kinase-PPPase family)
VVFFTLVNSALRSQLEIECARLGAPCISILDGPVQALGKFLGAEESHKPGGQHEMDSRYLERVEALNFAMQHDDGQNTQDLSGADVVLVGVSRSSKTPTCIYLAIRGIRAANVPVVPGVDLPERLFSLTKPLVVGLWLTPERLMQIRRNRLTTMGETKSTDYVDEEAVRMEVQFTRRLFERYEWPTIDVTRRSIEETAAAILNLIAERESAA